MVKKIGVAPATQPRSRPAHLTRRRPELTVPVFENDSAWIDESESWHPGNGRFKDIKASVMFSKDGWPVVCQQATSATSANAHARQMAHSEAGTDTLNEGPISGYDKTCRDLGFSGFNTFKLPGDVTWIIFENAPDSIDAAPVIYPAGPPHSS
eukprot:NODE_6860_length_602_cov_12.470163_g5870_i0.p1 GENE.NODE_6860_length_602_cov_12.470163_g5870_i0~~NODE_6860_length_602_cov_12.470163_g5870_i0.p1  ORF type:complete len:153 (+),score=9.45 NODE_6860_length_602_cov_12.470163_g5870_i0:72-530(+)